MNSEVPEKPRVKFLLVDDLPANLLALSGLLRRDGLELFDARSGPEALELLLVHEFALAFLDVQMPGMDGFELAQLMRGTDRTRHVPIIFVTAGSTDMKRRFQGYEAGAVDFLFKPVEPHILKSKADVFFDLARERENLRQSEAQLRTANRELTQLVAELQTARGEAVRGREEAEAATRSKDEFLGALSHELRTPLNPAMLLASALSEDPDLTPEARQDMHTIVNGIAVQMRLVDDLLDITRIAGGKLRLELGSVDAHAALQQTIEMMDGEIAEKNVRMVLQPEAERCHIHADPVRLQQIFWNVLKNAVKFSPQGGIVTLRTSNPVEHPSCFKVSISDTGIGIAPEMLEKVFDPFIQEVQHGSRRTTGGLGLGLAITRNLVTMQNGRVSAQSDGWEKGTTFHIELPLSGGGEQASAPPEAPAPEPSLPPAPRRILLVEDHKDTRQSIKILLERRGHTVFAAASAGEALALAAVQQCDLVISDLGLPDVDGHTLMVELRDLYALPGIAVSGYGAPKDEQQSRASGFLVHLVKPVDFGILERVLASVPVAGDV